MIDLDRVEAWIDRVSRRADELRRKGVLSIGVGGCTATFAAMETGHADADADASTKTDANDGSWTNDAEVEPLSPWEDPASYPSGIVPKLEIDDLSREERR